MTICNDVYQLIGKNISSKNTFVVEKKKFMVRVKFVYFVKIANV